MGEMDSVTGMNTVSNSSQKRPAQDAPETMRSKRAKYISAAWYAHMSSGKPLLTCGSNECKRCKVKCIRQEDDIDCQRCSTMNVTCVVVPTATQNAKESNKKRDNSAIDK